MILARNYPKNVHSDSDGDSAPLRTEGPECKRMGTKTSKLSWVLIKAAFTYTYFKQRYFSDLHDACSLFHRPQSIMFALIAYLGKGTLGENQIIKKYTFALVLGPHV